MGAEVWTEVWRWVGVEVGVGVGVWRNSPSCRRVKARRVVSSFRCLLKSMLRLLSSFLMRLISCRATQRSPLHHHIHPFTTTFTPSPQCSPLHHHHHLLPLHHSVHPFTPSPPHSPCHHHVHPFITRHPFLGPGPPPGLSGPRPPLRPPPRPPSGAPGPYLLGLLGKV